ncbi:glutamate racemase [Elizabethkingia ursingii]|jgi:glutamate racemase|uniref:Glutamate racemase n=1 Tax=Elizabethkingia ursingii TaxID=1756150 RepID=A0AAJ3NA64_9FLAO|nr:glutamate racemase [Elizabethkingia ursingii]MDR2229157.1 glutamate racemase [Flavobacteriaceae bacterium]AQX08291.1 glutamate racemase [Elizabethkingia ursingii]KUY27378.1 glutamate racemase [Elizabethkingia ursingii]MCL1665284.1 glutamate racemase [Elizabethkingia ursingii]MCL1671936.1 glutamate racemase [Elizabethkingia ursingii]
MKTLNKVNIQGLSPNQPIGVFDSGVGGLTVAKEIKRLLPNEDLIYFGDTKHLPYGEKSKEAIVEYSTKITNFLLEQNCKAIVIACNTATANALKEVLELVASRVPVIDVINPVAEKVAYEIHTNVGVIATKATVNSGLYRKSIRKHNKFIKVDELATPLLVPAIEEGFKNHPITHAIIYNYLSNSKLKNIETLILGCTHYPLLLDEIKQYYGNRVRVIDSPNIVANQLKIILDKYHLLNEQNHTPSYHFYLSDITKNFEKISRKFFGNKISLELKVL